MVRRRVDFCSHSSMIKLGVVEDITELFIVWTLPVLKFCNDEE